MSVGNSSFPPLSIPVNEVILQEKFIGQTNPGIEEDLISYTVPAGMRLYALQILSSCRLESKLRCLVESDQIGSWRHGPSKLNGTFVFSPYREINENETITIKSYAESFRPITDIEVYLQARLVTI